MATLLMSLQERDRLAVLRRVEDRQMTLKEASKRLSLSYRQAKRLWQVYRLRSDAGLVHGPRGRRSNNAPACDARRERAVALYQAQSESGSVRSTARGFAGGRLFAGGCQG